MRYFIDSNIVQIICFPQLVVDFVLYSKKATSIIFVRTKTKFMLILSNSQENDHRYIKFQKHSCYFQNSNSNLTNSSYTIQMSKYFSRMIFPVDTVFDMVMVRLCMPFQFHMWIWIVCGSSIEPNIWPYDRVVSVLHWTNEWKLFP